MMELVTEQTELITSLTFDSSARSGRLRRKDGIPKLIGQPRVRLDSAGLVPYIREAHLTPAGDTLAPRIRRVSTQAEPKVLVFRVLFTLTGLSLDLPRPTTATSVRCTTKPPGVEKSL